MNDAVLTPAGIRIATPDNWWLLPLEEHSRHQAIAALVDERIALEPRIAPMRGELVSRFRRTARDAAASGAVLCASMAMAADDAALSANLLVLVDRIALTENGEPTTDPSQIELAMRELTADETGARRGEVRIVELAGAGSAVRVRAHKVVAVSLVNRDVEVLSVQYFVPVPGSLDTAVLTFTSPSLAYEEALVGMFDAMAETFEFTGGPA